MPNQKTKSQADKFKEMARQLEADDDEAAFDEKLRKIVRDRSGDKGNGNPSDGKVRNDG